MSDLNGFRAYESAIICGMLADGHTLSSVQSHFENIRKTARKHSGGVSDVVYPIGIGVYESETAKNCAYEFLNEPRTLARVISHLTALGFEERLARYAYAYFVDNGVFKMSEKDGVPMLSRAVRK